MFLKRIYFKSIYLLIYAFSAHPETIPKYLQSIAVGSIAFGNLNNGFDCLGLLGKSGAFHIAT